ncbi:MAG: alcohol dehydrogenase catalytic domain-containing protein, partial [Paucibacter sp.]|nr:alcohol dehydrogenase catalytic domain-containing protein [Roseateles sp.]
MNTLAVVIDRPEHLSLSQLRLPALEDGDVVVEVEWSGISTGTERLIWTGTMPMFPGMGYPLVPGYEAVGRVIAVGPTSLQWIGQRVFVPGARC